MEFYILMNGISNTSKYLTKNNQMIDIDIITHYFLKRNPNLTTIIYQRRTKQLLIKRLQSLTVSHK